MPSVLCEYAFYSNLDDLKILKNNRSELVEATVKAICQYFGIEYKKEITVVQDREKNTEILLSDTPVELCMSWSSQEAGCTRLTVGTVSIEVNYVTGMLEIHNPKRYEEPVQIPFGKGEPFSLNCIIDRGILEFYGNDGILYGVVETEENVLREKITIVSDAKTEQFRAYELRKE